VSKGCALIVDDEEDLRVLVSTILDLNGYRTAAVAGGVQALSLVRQHGAPSVYVVDVRMPQMSGHALCRRLKADERTAGPVLMISAESSPADVDAAFECGCDDFLPKPFSPRQLLERIESLIRSAAD
jgi:DNA-binding response OmpR family regulator